MRKEDSSAQGQIITEILQHLHACNNSVKVKFLPRKNSRKLEVICHEIKTLPGFLWPRRHFGEN